MNRRHILVVLVALPLLVGACAGTTAAPTAAPTAIPSGTTDSAARGEVQTSDDGQVTVVATWAGPAAGATFDIKLDTHSVDLDALDLADATLRNDRGETLRALPWAAPKGGHHREGTLAFDGERSRVPRGSHVDRARHARDRRDRARPAVGDRGRRVTASADARRAEVADQSALDHCRGCRRRGPPGCLPRDRRNRAGAGPRGGAAPRRRALRWPDHAGFRHAGGALHRGSARSTGAIGSPRP